MRDDAKGALIVALIAAVAMASLMWMIPKAHGQNPDPAPHGRYHAYYQHWKQPGTGVPGISCCNANEYVDTLSGRMHIAGDCEPTHAEVRNGHWWARVPQYMIDTGVEPWVEIPDALVIHERNPSTEEGHLCGTEYWQEGKRPTIRVLCFVPPDTGG
jgi:hypothetical protein